MEITIKQKEKSEAIIRLQEINYEIKRLSIENIALLDTMNDNKKRFNVCKTDIEGEIVKDKISFPNAESRKNELAKRMNQVAIVNLSKNIDDAKRLITKNDIEISYLKRDFEIVKINLTLEVL